MEKQLADAIITEYLLKLYGFAVKRCCGYDEAEELCARIVEGVCRALRSRDGIRNVGGYIYTVSERAEDEMRRVRRAPVYLTRQRREIAYAYCFEDKLVAVIAAERGLPIGAVKRQFNKLRNELREESKMEHPIKRLGLKPVPAVAIGHSGTPPGSKRGPEDYLGNKLNLNIVYSVCWQQSTVAEIADELGVNPVFLEARIDMLE